MPPTTNELLISDLLVPNRINLVKIMAKKFLEKGQRFDIVSGPATVGESRTVIDISIDWSGVEVAGDGEVGTFANDLDYTFRVFRDTHTGRLFYDDDNGY